jgi:hypothetical protein
MAQKLAYFGDEPDPQGLNDGTLELLLEYPGAIRVPGYEGSRVGKYSRKRKRIQVCFAVPKHLLNSPRFAEYYFECLETAIAIAKKRFDQDGIPFDLQRHLGFVESLRKLDLRAAQPPPWLKSLLDGNPEELA